MKDQRVFYLQELARALGPAFIEVERVRTYGFKSSLFIGELNVRAGIQRPGREKQVTQTVSYQNQLRSLKQTNLSGGGGLAAICTVWWLAK